MTEPTAVVLEQQVELRVTGQPDVKNMYGSGHIRPTEATFRYMASGLRAQVYGRWVREDGEMTDAPCSNDYAAHEGDTSEWPGWLADLAAAWRPTTPDEDPARIDRLYSEFTEHASVQSIDLHIQRAQRQEHRWRLRVERLVNLRAARVRQRERGEWPAAGARQGGASS